MPKTLYVKATKARKNFFELVDRVADGEIIVYIENSKTNSTVVLDKDEGTRKIFPVKKKKESILDLYGSLKTNIPYNPNDTKIAHEMYAKEQGEKLERMK